MLHHKRSGVLWTRQLAQLKGAARDEPMEMREKGIGIRES
jgi:hypothetical protein